MVSMLAVNWWTQEATATSFIWQPKCFGRQKIRSITIDMCMVLFVSAA